MLSFRTTILAGVTAFALAAPAAGAQVTEYPQTLYWGAGLVDIPVAWVSPLSGDFALNYSGKSFTKDPVGQQINTSNTLNSQLTFSVSLFGRAELGVAAYSGNPEEGFFGQALLLRQEDFAERGGFVARWLIPSLAVGARNIGPYDKIDRFGIGYKLTPPSGGNPNAEHVADSLHQGFKTNNTFYGVATKDFSLAQIRPNFPDVDVGLSIGYGNGLFKDDGGLGASYAKNGTGGLFYGAKADFKPAPTTTITLMADNNAWDFNIGASALYRGLRAGVYYTELGAGSAPSGAASTTANPTTFYNYSKFAFTLGWQSNVYALLHGDFLQSKAAQLERQRQALLAEITARQQRIAALELEINRYEAQNLLELEQRRAAAESQLRQEREALKRLEDRLKRVESQTPPTPPATTPPTSVPPTTPPATPPTTPPTTPNASSASGSTIPPTTPNASSASGSTIPPAV
jgi:uncharacterized coiled-coil protein SlyX